MRDDRLTVVGLLLLGALAWTSPPLLRAAASARHPPNPVLYALAHGQSLVWSPASHVPKSIDGGCLGAPGRPPQPLDGWPGLLFGAPLDLNGASQDDLEALPHIGPKTAAAILETRRELGGFRSVDELLDARGIGPKTLERLRPLVRVGAATSFRGGS